MDSIDVSMKVDLNLIYEKTLEPWPNKYEPKRYYVDFWKKKFQSEIDSYNEKYHVYRFQDEIKAYFDTDGYLHVYCKDKRLAAEIYSYFNNWYEYICQKNFADNIRFLNIGMMLEPFHTDLNDGFVQIRYKDMVCNLSPDQLEKIAPEYAQVGEYKGTCITGVDTGIPRLDKIITTMLDD